MSGSRIDSQRRTNCSGNGGEKIATENVFQRRHYKCNSVFVVVFIPISLISISRQKNQKKTNNILTTSLLRAGGTEVEGIATNGRQDCWLRHQYFSNSQRSTRSEKRRNENMKNGDAKTVKSSSFEADADGKQRWLRQYFCNSKSSESFRLCNMRSSSSFSSHF